MAQQTAVDWFEQKISKYISYHYDKAYEEHNEVTDIFEKAKAMEKDQIKDAYQAGASDSGIIESEQYYNETYESNKD